MTRLEHRYVSGAEVIVLLADDSLVAPPGLRLKRDGEFVVFEHESVKAVRKPRAKPVDDGRRGSRVPHDFTPDERNLGWARESAPSVDPVQETAVFIDYWASVAGAKGIKLDWQATWRNSVRMTHRRNVEHGWKSSVKRERPTTANDAKALWLHDHGVTESEWEARKADAEWVAMIKRRGRVA